MSSPLASPLNACKLTSLDEQIAAQHAVIARFEAVLWDGGFNERLLPSYQSALRRHRIALNLVAAQPLDAEMRAALQASIRREVDAQMVLEVNYQDEIPRTVSGKHRFVIGMAGRS